LSPKRSARIYKASGQNSTTANKSRKDRNFGNSFKYGSSALDSNRQSKMSETNSLSFLGEYNDAEKERIQRLVEEENNLSNS
jgi:hypothetical protein